MPPTRKGMGNRGGGGESIIINILFFVQGKEGEKGRESMPGWFHKEEKKIGKKGEQFQTFLRTSCPKKKKKKNRADLIEWVSERPEQKRKRTAEQHCFPLYRKKEGEDWLEGFGRGKGGERRDRGGGLPQRLSSTEELKKKERRRPVEGLRRRGRGEKKP